MILGVEAHFALSFLAGVIAAVNPCGFVLLPTYLTYFLGIEGARPGTQRAAIGRALMVSGAVSAGFLAVFLIIGIITRSLTTWIRDEGADYLSMGVGVLLLITGVAMLFGKHIPLMTPKLDVGGRDTSFRSMFLYGISYALASIGCTIGTFSGTVLSRVGRDGYLSGVLAIAFYGLGMALILSALTVTLALARTGMLRVLRRAMARIELLSGVSLVLAGLYLMWYGYTALTDQRSAVTDWAIELEGRVATRLNNFGATQLLLVLGGITAIAIIAVVVRRRPSTTPTEG
jgi:cytochrome c-type biogenesis protein